VLLVERTQSHVTQHQAVSRNVNERGSNRRQRQRQRRQRRAGDADMSHRGGNPSTWRPQRSTLDGSQVFFVVVVVVVDTAVNRIRLVVFPHRFPVGHSTSTEPGDACRLHRRRIIPQRQIDRYSDTFTVVGRRPWRVTPSLQYIYIYIYIYSFATRRFFLRPWSEAMLPRPTKSEKDMIGTAAQKYIWIFWGCGGQLDGHRQRRVPILTDGASS